MLRWDALSDNFPFEQPCELYVTQARKRNDSLYCRGEKSYACINRTNVSPRSLKWLTQDHSKSQRSPDLLHSLNYMPFFLVLWFTSYHKCQWDISLGEQCEKAPQHPVTVDSMGEYSGPFAISLCSTLVELQVVDKSSNKHRWQGHWSFRQHASCNATLIGNLPENRRTLKCLVCVLSSRIDCFFIFS